MLSSYDVAFSAPYIFYLLAPGTKNHSARGGAPSTDTITSVPRNVAFM